MQSQTLVRKPAALAIALAFVAGIAATHFYSARPAHAEQAKQAALVDRATLPNFSALVDAVGPAVVSIRVEREAKTAMAQPNGPGGDADPREFFFGLPPGAEGEREMPPVQGGGSGFIIGKDGYILTNAHVVAGASDIVVGLADDREFKAKVLGFDRKTDVALIKIDATGLPAVKVGDPAKTKVGEWVAAIGAPFGLDQTVTAGIVSAKSRMLPNETYVPFIQTDVAVNPGNSGGPLFNLDGEVIGINSQIFSRTGGYMGLSFAIPIDIAVKVKDELQQYGTVTRGKLGVVIQDLNKELAESFGVKRDEGALVSSVEPGGPAATAGLQSGDIIVKVDAEAVSKAADISRRIGAMKPGQTAKLELLRNGTRVEVSAKLVEMPGDRVAEGRQSAPPKLGVVVRSLTADEQRRMGEAGGVVVERAEGPAARSGIKKGDVIIALNNKKIEGADQLKKLVDEAGKSVALLVQRDGARLYIPVTLG